MESVEKLSQLLNLHMSDDSSEAGGKRKWCISVSPLGGRGVFATQDIEPHEVICVEQPLIIGPTGRVGSQLNICTLCFTSLNKENFLCKRGCSIPVCENCTDKHEKECELLKSWEPFEPNKVNKHSIRGMTIVRGLLLSEDMKNLIKTMQANKSPTYKTEIQDLSKCFRKFPQDEETLNFMLNVVEVLNTNAFEVFNPKETHEAGLRGLFPFAGVMNHQCTPNTSHSFDEFCRMIIKAVKHIPKGAEIYTTYTKILWSNMTRRLFLNMTKHFSCECYRCIDPTENGTYISAMRCRDKECGGLALPVDCFTVYSPWRCLECQTIYDSKIMLKTQDFILGILTAKSSSCNIPDLIDFIAQKLPKICPPSNQFVLEVKMQVIWKMAKSIGTFSEKEVKTAIQYCNDILKVLDKLGAGECTLKHLMLTEIKKFLVVDDNIKRECSG